MVKTMGYVLSAFILGVFLESRYLLLQPPQQVTPSSTLETTIDQGQISEPLDWTQGGTITLI